MPRRWVPDDDEPDRTLLGDFACNNKQMAQKLLMGFICLRQSGQACFLLWDHQEVDRSLRADVFKGQCCGVLIQYGGWDLL